MYTVNVALKGSHLFATADHSSTNQASAERLLDIILTKFPISEGYSVSITYYPNTGYMRNVTDISKISNIIKELSLGK